MSTGNNMLFRKKDAVLGQNKLGLDAERRQIKTGASRVRACFYDAKSESREIAGILPKKQAFQAEMQSKITKILEEMVCESISSRQQKENKDKLEAIFLEIYGKTGKKIVVYLDCEPPFELSLLRKASNPRNYDTYLHYSWNGKKGEGAYVLVQAGGMPGGISTDLYKGSNTRGWGMRDFADKRVIPEKVRSFLLHAL